ncbi:MAG: ATP-binding protein [Brevibacillus sp.]|nr:ATP-binding protein [Brevibacillus sp.]
MQNCFVNIRIEHDIYLALHHVRLMMDKLSFSKMDKQKVLVAVSELTRNILDHAGANGSFSCECIENQGIRLIIQDSGKGIDNLHQILSGEGTPNRRGLGLGLSGAKRMMDEFTIKTSKEGTTIVCVKWNGK